MPKDSWWLRLASMSACPVLGEAISGTKSRGMAIWATVEWIDRRVARRNWPSSVMTVTASARATLIVRGVPERGSSLSPSRPRSTKPRRLLPTVTSLQPSAAAVSTVVCSAAAQRARTALPGRCPRLCLGSAGQECRVRLAAHGSEAGVFAELPPECCQLAQVTSHQDT